MHADQPKHAHLNRSLWPESHEVFRHEPMLCATPGAPTHIAAVVLKDESRLGAGELITRIAAGAIYFHVPHEHSVRHAEYRTTGTPIVLKTRLCNACGVHVLYG